jgi:DME family drug/metabolite transporter
MSWVATGPGLAVATYLAVLTTALAYLLYARGLRTTAVTTATTLGLAEPAVAAVLGLAVLGEHLTATGFAGLGVLAISLVIAAWPSPRPTTTARPGRELGQPQKRATPLTPHRRRPADESRSALGAVDTARTAPFGDRAESPAGNPCQWVLRDGGG